jgi:hypothetical protein
MLQGNYHSGVSRFNYEESVLNIGLYGKDKRVKEVNDEGFCNRPYCSGPDN